MHEALKKGINDRKSMANTEAQITQYDAQQDAQIISAGFKAATDFAQSAISTYSQSEMRKDAPALVKGLRQLADEYNDPDDPEAYQKFTEARKEYIDSYLEGKNFVFRSVFNQQFRSKYEDDSFDYFDEQFTNSIYAKNKTNAIQIMNDSVDSFVNGEDLSLYENNTIYKTTVDKDGIHVTQEAVQLKNTWATDLPTDTNDANLNEQNRKQNEFNKLLNIQYSAASLMMSMDEAKAYVTSQIPSIESQAMRSEIFNMAEIYSQGVTTVDASGMETTRHYTVDEAKQELYGQYKTGNKTPYTGRTISAEESASYKQIVDSVVDNAYNDMFVTNSKRLVFDEDGWFKEHQRTGYSESDLYSYLASCGMIELDSNGKPISHYGIDDDTWLSIVQMTEGNDKVYRANAWLMNPDDVNEDGLRNLEDVDEDVRYLIAWDGVLANAHLTSEGVFKSLNGSIILPQSTVDYLNGKGANRELSTAIGNLFGTSVETESSEGTKNVSEESATPEPTTVSPNIGGNPIEPAETEGTTFNPKTASASDYLLANKLFSYDGYEGQYEYIDAMIKAEKGDDYVITDADRIAQYNKNENTIDRIIKQNLSALKELGITTVDEARSWMEDQLGLSEMDAKYLDFFLNRIESTNNKYVNTYKVLAAIEGGGWKFGNEYEGNPVGEEVCVGILKTSIKNLIPFINNEEFEKKYGITLDEAIKEYEQSIGLTDVWQTSNGEVRQDNLDSNISEYQYYYGLFDELSAYYMALYPEETYSNICANFNGRAEKVYVYQLENDYLESKAMLEKSPWYQSVKDNPLYGSPLAHLDSLNAIKEYANYEMTDLVQNEFGTWKATKSYDGWFGDIMQRLLEGEDLSYLQNWVQGSSVISQDDTEWFCGNGKDKKAFTYADALGNLTMNPDIVSEAQAVANKIGSRYQNSFWKSMINTVANAKIEELGQKEINDLVSLAITGYYEQFSLSATEENKKNIKTTTDATGKKQQYVDLNDTFESRMSDYEEDYLSGKFNFLGFNEIINDYANGKGGVAQFWAETFTMLNDTKFEGNKDIVFIDSALEALGITNDLDINMSKKEYINGLEKLFYFDKGNYSGEADYVLRLAASMKAVYEHTMSPESASAYGRLEYMDVAQNIIYTDAISPSERKNGTYFSLHSDGSYNLNYYDKDGNKQVINMKFIEPEEFPKTVEKVEKEVNSFVKDNYIVNYILDNENNQNEMYIGNYLNYALSQSDTYMGLYAAMDVITKHTNLGRTNGIKISWTGDEKFKNKNQFLKTVKFERVDFADTTYGNVRADLLWNYSKFMHNGVSGGGAPVTVRGGASASGGASQVSLSNI